jgi:ATP-binding cassette subfamily B protein
LKHLKALNKYFWKYKLRLSVGVLFIIISNYFGVLAPQITGFIIEFVQRSLPGYQPRGRQRSYDVMVQKFIDWIEDLPVTPLQIVLISGGLILATALIRGFFMFLMRQTIIVMSRHIEYDQKNDVYQQYQKLDSYFL